MPTSHLSGPDPRHHEPTKCGQPLVRRWAENRGAGGGEQGEGSLTHCLPSRRLGWALDGQRLLASPNGALRGQTVPGLDSTGQQAAFLRNCPRAVPVPRQFRTLGFHGTSVPHRNRAEGRQSGPNQIPTSRNRELTLVRGASGSPFRAPPHPAEPSSCPPRPPAQPPPPALRPTALGRSASHRRTPLRRTRRTQARASR